MIDEVHRILEQDDGPSGDAGSKRRKAAQIISNLIAEGRDRGEGLVLIDQLPEILPYRAAVLAQSAIIHDIHNQFSVDYVCKLFRYLHKIPKLEIGQVIIVTPDNKNGVAVRITPLPMRDVSNEEIKSYMKDFYEQHSWNEEEITNFRDLMMGPYASLPAKIDEFCAKIELKYLINNDNPNNSFIIQGKTYLLDEIKTFKGEIQKINFKLMKGVKELRRSEKKS